MGAFSLLWQLSMLIEALFSRFQWGFLLLSLSSSFFFFAWGTFLCANSMGNLADHLSTRKQEVLQADPRSASMAGRILAAVYRQLVHQNRRIAELDDPPRYAEIFRLLLMSSISAAGVAQFFRGVRGLPLVRTRERGLIVEHGAKLTPRSGTI